MHLEQSAVEVEDGGLGEACGDLAEIASVDVGGDEGAAVEVDGAADVAAGGRAEGDALVVGGGEEYCGVNGVGIVAPRSQPLRR